jgi:hypothetical protein
MARVTPVDHLCFEKSVPDESRLFLGAYKGSDRNAVGVTSIQIRAASDSGGSSHSRHEMLLGKTIHIVWIGNRHRAIIAVVGINELGTLGLLIAVGWRICFGLRGWLARRIATVSRTNLLHVREHTCPIPTNACLSGFKQSGPRVILSLLTASKRCTVDRSWRA